MQQRVNRSSKQAWQIPPPLEAARSLHGIRRPQQAQTKVSAARQERQMCRPQNFSILAGGSSLPQMTQTAVDSAVFGMTGFLPPVKM